MSQYYKIKYASPSKHEHWYESDDGQVVAVSTCILNEPGARCTTPPLDPGKEMQGSRFVRVAKLPKYAARALAEAKRFTF